MSQNRLYSFTANRKKSYKALIYQHLDQNGIPTQIFDVEVDIDVDAKTVPNGRIIAHEFVTRSLKTISVNKLTSYMHWKFRHCQRSNNPRIVPVRSGGRFTHLHSSLEWIRSIIEVEFDFHVGVQNCLRESNKKHLEKYRKTQFDYYLPTFYKM